MKAVNKNLVIKNRSVRLVPSPLPGSYWITVDFLMLMEFLINEFNWFLRFLGLLSYMLLKFRKRIELKLKESEKQKTGWCFIESLKFLLSCYQSFWNDSDVYRAYSTCYKVQSSPFSCPCWPSHLTMTLIKQKLYTILQKLWSSEL